MMEGKAEEWLGAGEELARMTSGEPPSRTATGTTSERPMRSRGIPAFARPIQDCSAEAEARCVSADAVREPEDTDPHAACILCHALQVGNKISHNYKSLGPQRIAGTTPLWCASSDSGAAS